MNLINDVYKIVVPDDFADSDAKCTSLKLFQKISERKSEDSQSCTMNIQTLILRNQSLNGILSKFGSEIISF